MKNKKLINRRDQSYLVCFRKYLVTLLIIGAFLVVSAAFGPSPQKAQEQSVVPTFTSDTSSVTPPWDPFFASPATVADFGAATRPFGIATGDFDGDGKVDMVVGRTTGNIAFVKGNGNGTFAAPVVFAWKQAFFNAWAFAAGDANNDGNLDVIWGANATSTGCSIYPIPAGLNCATAGGTTVTVQKGNVRVFYGNGDGTFQENTYFISGVRHNAGTYLYLAFSDAGSLAVGDVDGDSQVEIIVGGIVMADTAVMVLKRDDVVFWPWNWPYRQAANCSGPTVSSPPPTAYCSPIYWPATVIQNSPWGLALGDADGDGDNDLFVGDRALYVYLFLNDGFGHFTLKDGNAAVLNRPNAYLGHDSYRAAVGYTPSLASGDINGDGKADVVLGLHSGTQTPAGNVPNDGFVLLDVSKGSGHTGFGNLADIGTMARGVNVIDVNGDGALDIVAGEYDGKIKLLRQLPPIDTDNDGISDYVDNAPSDANAPRLDMNTDGSINHRDQLDNDFDTVLGDPEIPATWQRLGDVADLDDDNDGVMDTADNCVLTANADQADKDSDLIGDVCDPLDNRDMDGDGVPNGPAAGDPLYDKTRAAKIKWSMGNTHFVIRIDALGRFFQNEFTQIMTDAATLTPAEWAAKCWENYDPGDVVVGGQPYEPCGTDPTQPATLEGGKEVPISLLTIPKQLWTDPPVVTWINDRNNNLLFELGQHGSYHANNTPRSDWGSDPDRNYFSCETCGLTFAESYELLKVGQDTLVGNYANKWVTESGATGGSPKIDWMTSVNPLISYAPPYNASDTIGRQGSSQLGYPAFSASIYEEQSPIFSPEGSHHEMFDQFGTFHVSADLQLNPPDTSGGAYDVTAYGNYLQSRTQAGGLNTWLIEEVDWSGRPCNDDPRLNPNGTDAPANCPEAGGAATNRENNTVYAARWQGWMQLLDYVKNYPDGIAMTMGEVGLAQSFDNAPTADNPDQADSDHDGIGDVIDGAALVATDVLLSRNLAGELSAALKNGADIPIAGQNIEFGFDADGDGTAETYAANTDSNGVARINVTPTRAIGPTTFTVYWDGKVATANDSGDVTVGDATTITLSTANPTSGQVTDFVTVEATLVDSDEIALVGKTIAFAIGSATGSGVTDSFGKASATITLLGPADTATLQADFAGGGLLGPSSASSAFTVNKEDTALSLPNAIARKRGRAIARATLREADSVLLAGKVVEFYVEEKVRNRNVFVSIGTATTDTNGVASLEIPTRYISSTPRPIRAIFMEDDSFNASSADASVYRQ